MGAGAVRCGALWRGGVRWITRVFRPLGLAFFQQKKPREAGHGKGGYNSTLFLSSDWGLSKKP